MSDALVEHWANPQWQERGGDPLTKKEKMNRIEHWKSWSPKAATRISRSTSRATFASRELSRVYLIDGICTDVATTKSKNSGAPLETRTVKIGRDGKFTQQFDLRENDAVLITLKPQR
jgi:hypothetical protein